MQPSYRVASAPPPATVIVYRGQALWSLLLVTVTLLGATAVLVDVALDSVVGPLPLIFVPIPLSVLWSVWRWARLTIDPASRALRVERWQWPLRRTRESIPFDELRAVVVRSALPFAGWRRARSI